MVADYDLRRQVVTPTPSSAIPKSATVFGSGFSWIVPGPSAAKPVTLAPPLVFPGLQVLRLSQTMMCNSASTPFALVVITSLAVAHVPLVFVNENVISDDAFLNPSKESIVKLNVPNPSTFWSPILSV